MIQWNYMSTNDVRVCQAVSRFWLSLMLLVLIFSVVLSYYYIQSFMMREEDSTTNLKTTFEKALSKGYLTKDERQLKIHGIESDFKHWESLERYRTGLELANNLGFNYIRFITSRVIHQVDPTDFPTVNSRVQNYTTLLKTFDLKLIPVLFDWDLWETAPRDNDFYRMWIDLWVDNLPDSYVYSWDLFNEPAGMPELYELIVFANEYLRTRTQRPVTIGFHDVTRANPDKYYTEAFNNLVNLSDIISYHFYSYKLLIEDPEFDVYNEFAEKLQWLGSFNKYYLIGELGFSATKDFEQIQKYYMANLLHKMKDEASKNDNFLGYIIWELRDDKDESWEPIPPIEKELRGFWGVLRYDFSQKPVVEVLP